MPRAHEDAILRLIGREVLGGRTDLARYWAGVFAVARDESLTPAEVASAASAAFADLLAA